MITMNELVDLRMQQHIAHEIYRQQIMQRIPDPFPHMLGMGGASGMPMARHMLLPPPRVTLPGVELTLQNDDLWQQFHHIGTEMIITKSGRRMFPSMRLTLGGLEEETNYCVLLEMVPIGDCRFKFSGSQWVPAGGAEPQSPQRMFLHPDSPATGAHWQSQAILFNKVKLTNNTLDSAGHIVLASMHKYQPRIHVIRTADLTQIPWAPQQAFVFPETEFVAVTAYQNDRITKLKIDNNPFAKGFRETGQSRCKRKMSSSLSDDDQEQAPQQQSMQSQSPQQQHQQRRLNMLSPMKCILPRTSIAMDTTGNGSSNNNINKHNNSDNHLSNKTLPHANSSGSSSSVDVSEMDDVVVVVDATTDAPHIKRLRSNGSASPTLSMLDELNNGGADATGNYLKHTNSNNNHCNSNSSTNANNSSSNSTSNNNNNSNKYNHLLLPQAQNSMVSAADGGCIAIADDVATSAFMHHLQQNMQTLLRPSLAFDFACTYFARTPNIYAIPPPTQQQQQHQEHFMQQESQQQHPYHNSLATYNLQHANLPHAMDVLTNRIVESTNATPTTTIRTTPPSPPSLPSTHKAIVVEEPPLNVVECETNDVANDQASSATMRSTQPPQAPATAGKRKGFSISAILDGNS